MYAPLSFVSKKIIQIRNFPAGFTGFTSFSSVLKAQQGHLQIRHIVEQYFGISHLHDRGTGPNLQASSKTNSTPGSGRRPSTWLEK